MFRVAFRKEVLHKQTRKEGREGGVSGNLGGGTTEGGNGKGGQETIRALHGVTVSIIPTMVGNKRKRVRGLVLGCNFKEKRRLKGRWAGG